MDTKAITASDEKFDALEWNVNKSISALFRSDEMERQIIPRTHSAFELDARPH
jgi:hypothetical protein